MNVKDLEINEVHAYDGKEYNGIRIEWNANIGFGTCDIYREKSDGSGKWKAATEHMCSNADKRFLRMLLGKLAEMVEVVE